MALQAYNYSIFSKCNLSHQTLTLRSDFIPYWIYSLILKALKGTSDSQ